MELVKNRSELGKDGVDFVKNVLETRWTATFHVLNVIKTSYGRDENEMAKSRTVQERSSVVVEAFWPELPVFTRHQLRLSENEFCVKGPLEFP